MEKTRKPKAAGILDIISAVFVLGQGFGCLLQWHTVEAKISFYIIVVAGVLAIVGGIYAIRRKMWGLALAGSITAIFSSIPLLGGLPVGITATILTVLSKDEFT